MKHENCRTCLIYDEMIDGILAPCDEEDAWKKHDCTAYKDGIPEEIWKGKTACQEKVTKSL